MSLSCDRLCSTPRVGRSKGPTSSQSVRPRRDAAGTVGQVGGSRSRSARFTQHEMETARRLHDRCHKSCWNQPTANRSPKRCFSAPLFFDAAQVAIANRSWAVSFSGPAPPRSGSTFQQQPAAIPSCGSTSPTERLSSCGQLSVRVVDWVASAMDAQNPCGVRGGIQGQPS